jgi:hypothetical protein
VEVRHTYRDDGCLIVRDNDDPGRYYVLVTGNPPTLTIHGWIPGDRARAVGEVRNPHGYRSSWFVRQHLLTPAKAANDSGTDSPDRASTDPGAR